jgi:DNA-binding NarL/FixJ family response regulator
MAVRTIASGGALLDPHITGRVIAAFADAGAARTRAGLVAGLSEREKEVLTLVARGLSNAEIAARLYLGEATVKTHVSRLLAKLGARDRVQAVAVAYESGLVRPGEA